MYGRHYVGRDIRETLSEKVICEDRQVEAGGKWHAGKSVHAEEAAKIIAPQQDTFSLFK